MNKQPAPITSGEVPHRERQEAQPSPLPVVDTPITVQFKASRSSVKETIAEAYHQAARADADMAAAMRTLEQARSVLLTEPDGFKVWGRLDEAIGAADASTLRPTFSALRVWFRNQLFDQQRKRLGDLFERDREVGWCEWLRTYAEGLARWRLLLCQNLVDAPLSFPEQFHTPYDFKRATQLILHERWDEVYQFFTYLAEQEFLHAHTRARLLIPAGQIYLYYLSRRNLALTLFQQAQQLAPRLGCVLAALGGYYREQNDLVTSRPYLEQAMQAAPNEVESYAYLGDLEEKQGNLEEARTWYQAAINKAIGDSIGYSRLLRLYGRPEFIERYESHIAPLAERAIAVDETGEYRTYLDVGDAYAASRRYDTAHQWYDKAIRLEPSRLGGYIQKGFTYLEDGESRDDAAREAFDASIRVAPEAYNGYWGMGQLAERRGQWAEAAEWYAQAMRRQPEYYSSLQSRVGEMQWKMGLLEQAEATLLGALRHDPTNDATVISLANDYYKVQDKPEEALQLYKQIREIKGDAFEADYQNRVGNLYYHEEEYEKAAQHYLNAIRSDDKEAVYFSNLSRAYRELERWREAREYLKKAYDLHGDRQKYESQLVGVYRAHGQALEKSLPTSTDALERLHEAIADIRAELEQAQSKEPFSDQLALLEQMRVFVVRYGTNALTFDPVDKPIRIRVASELTRFILDANRTDLSKDFSSLIEDMRERLRQRYGLRVPGLFFSELIESDIPLGSYQIEVMDERVTDGRIETYQGSELQERLLQLVESVLTDHLDKLCGHQETANLLEQCDTNDCAQIKDDPHKLMALTRRLKTILRQRESIANLALIAAEVNKRAMSSSSEGDQSRPKRPTPELSPGITKLILYVGKLGRANRVELASEFENLQRQFFDKLGVIMPRVAISDSVLGFRLQINEEELPTEFTASAPVQFLAAELDRRADELLTINIVEYYLTKLKTVSPGLVNVIRHCFSVEELTRLLRERLSRGSSIKNLPRVLEELLSVESNTF